MSSSVFFFSSRRRHTRCYRDWSSDVCSSDLPGRRLLLDTHTLLWWLTGDPHLSPAARRVIAQASALAFVSAASAWEIATKVRLGRLDDPQGVTDSLGAHLRAQGFRELPITLEHGRRAGKLPGPPKDP